MNKIGNRNDQEYVSYLADFNRRFQSNKVLFTTSADSLWDIYIACFPKQERQFHNCSACRHFIEHYGHLAAIVDNKIVSAVWTGNELFERALKDRVERAKITSIFLSNKEIFGQPFTGPWNHLSLINPNVYYSRLLTSHQAMCEKREDYNNLHNCRYSFVTYDTAIRLLETDSLYRSEKVLGQAKFLRDWQAASEVIKWQMVATAPSGFCHPNSSMIATLLDDIESGLSFDDVAARFKAKMHPLQYQRPTAPPKEGLIDAAEKIVAKMASEGALQRRFARLEELEKVWEKFTKETPSGVFAGLRDKSQVSNSLVGLPVTMTWVKFIETVAPLANCLELYVTSERDNYGPFVTNANADAPNMLQWNNPVSYYVYHGGSMPSRFNIKPGWVNVEALVLKPHMWSGNRTMDHHGKGVCFVLEGARETNSSELAIFPENLRSEYHPIRKVIEAYSKSRGISGIGVPHAAGLMCTDEFDVRVRVNGLQEYKIDRWD